MPPAAIIIIARVSSGARTNIIDYRSPSTDTHLGT